MNSSVPAPLRQADIDMFTIAAKQARASKEFGDRAIPVWQEPTPLPPARGFGKQQKQRPLAR